MAAAVARVCVDSPLPHLDKPFDYAIPDPLIGVVDVGSRVRVRMAGRLLSGVVTSLSDDSAYEDRLLPIRSSAALPSYNADAIDLAGQVARRYGGSLWDVLRLMAPPRVAAVEKRAATAAAPVQSDLRGAVRAALGVDDVVVTGIGQRTVWAAAPDRDRSTIPAYALVGTALAAIADEGSAVIVVPDARAIATVLAECTRRGLTRWTARSGGEVAVLDHDDGPSVRYGNYLAAMHGHAPVVIGTRPTALQPVPQLSFIAIWDEGSSAYEDPHAPYPHARTVVAMRATESVTAILGSFAPSVDAMALVEHGWADVTVPDRRQVRSVIPAIDVLTDERRDAEGGSGWHWMPGTAWRALRSAWQQGPVAVMVPRAGYVRAVTCARCNAWAECRTCEGPLHLAGKDATLTCQSCGASQQDWHCPHCHSARVKHVRQGIERIAEQLERMAPDQPIHLSSAATGVLPDHHATAGITVATPAALPAVDGGYRHLAILDAGAATGTHLGAELTTLRWWLNAAALVAPRSLGGGVSVIGLLPDQIRTALMTWDPVTAARHEYTERVSLGLPPHRRWVSLDGDDVDIEDVLKASGVPRDGDDQITVVRHASGVGLLAPRSRMQSIVDQARSQQRQASAQQRVLRMRVDGRMYIDA